MEGAWHNKQNARAPAKKPTGTLAPVNAAQAARSLPLKFTTACREGQRRQHVRCRRGRRQVKALGLAHRPREAYASRKRRVAQSCSAQRVCAHHSPVLPKPGERSMTGKRGTSRDGIFGRSPRTAACAARCAAESTQAVLCDSSTGWVACRRGPHTPGRTHATCERPHSFPFLPT